MDNILALTATPYLSGSGNPDTAFEVVNGAPGGFSPYAPGDLGKLFIQGDRIYQKVLLHEDAIVVAVGQLLYWQDRSKYVVTNNALDGMLGVSEDMPDGEPESFRNNVAGSIRGVIPVNAQFFMLIHGNNVPILEAGAATPGMMLIADTGAAAVAIGVPIGMPLTHQRLGRVVGPTTDGSCLADFDVVNS